MTFDYVYTVGIPLMILLVAWIGIHRLDKQAK
jgi:hypothetical protein